MQKQLSETSPVVVINMLAFATHIMNHGNEAKCFNLSRRKLMFLRTLFYLNYYYKYGVMYEFIKQKITLEKRHALCNRNFNLPLLFKHRKFLTILRT